MADITKKLLRYAPRTYLSAEHGPYHAFKPHIRGDMMPAFIKKLAPHLDAAGVKFDKWRVIHSILMHDAHLSAYPQAHGYIHSEHMAAQGAFNWLLDNGAPEKHARGVYYDIMGTNPGHDIESTEGMILAALDIGNIGGDYPAFRKRFLDIKREGEIASGKPRTFKEVALGSLKFMPFFLRSMIELTPAARAGKGASEWHLRAISNLSRLFAEAHGGRKKVEHIVQIGAAKNPLASTESLQEHQLYVGIDPDARGRENALARVMKFQAQVKGAGPAYLIPGQGNAMSVPNEFANRIVYRDVKHSAIDFAEIKRVLAEGGDIVVEETRPASEKVTSGRPNFRQVSSNFKSNGFKLVEKAGKVGAEGQYKLVFERE